MQTGRTTEMTNPHIFTEAATKIRGFGQQISPQILAELKAIYVPLQPPPPTDVRIERDLSYGPHERHRLNLFLPPGPATDVLVFVHGGGFVTGDKDETPGAFYDNVGLWAASEGLIGVTLNYRRAPDYPWPAGRDDTGAAVDWLRDNVVRYGGDPGRIFLMGHSAGACHVAGFVGTPGAVKKLAGCICVSGVYDLTISPVNTAYFGADTALYAERSPLVAFGSAEIPMLVLLAENDPEFVQRHGLSLLDTVLRERKKLPKFGYIAGHNHFSTLLHLNSPDTSLADQLSDFIRRN